MNLWLCHYINNYISIMSNIKHKGYCHELKFAEQAFLPGRARTSAMVSSTSAVQPETRTEHYNILLLNVL